MKLSEIIHRLGFSRVDEVTERVGYKNSASFYLLKKNNPERFKCILIGASMQNAFENGRDINTLVGVIKEMDWE